jgi:hypothetical protein
MPSQQLIDDQTGGATSAPFTVTKQMLPVSIYADNLAGSEVCSIQRVTPDGTSYNVYDGGSQLQLVAASKTDLQIASVGIYKAVLGSTAGACSVFISWTKGDSQDI